MTGHNWCTVALLGARALVGGALLARPRGLLAAVCGQTPNEKVIVYARVLGARHLSEAAILWRWTTPAVVRTGAAVDAIHAASAVALVKTDTTLASQPSTSPPRAPLLFLAPHSPRTGPQARPASLARRHLVSPPHES